MSEIRIRSMYKYPPHGGWSGSCLIDLKGKIYPCYPCGHESTAQQYAGVSAWVAVNLGWVRIGSTYIENTRPLTDSQHDALLLVLELHRVDKYFLPDMENSLLRVLSGEVGDFFSSDINPDFAARIKE